MQGKLNVFKILDVAVRLETEYLEKTMLGEKIGPK